MQLNQPLTWLTFRQIPTDITELLHSLAQRLLRLHELTFGGQAAPLYA